MLVVMSADASAPPAARPRARAPTPALLEIASTGLITRLAAVMTMVDRLVPNRLWELFHRLVLDELGTRGALDLSRCAIDR